MNPYQRYHSFDKIINVIKIIVFASLISIIIIEKLKAGSCNHLHGSPFNGNKQSTDNYHSGLTVFSGLGFRNESAFHEYQIRKINA